MRVVRDARDAGIKAAVLSNSLGRAPFDPYAAWDLTGNFDVVVLSHEVGIRKPDPAIYRLTAERMGLKPAECVFADDTEINLETAVTLGMTPVYSLEEDILAARLRLALGLPRR